MAKSTENLPVRPTHHWLDPLESVYDEMDRFLTPYLKRSPARRLGLTGDDEGRVFANLDLSESEDEVTVEIDVPGIKRDDIDVTLTDSMLTVKGRREAHAEEKQKNFRRSEREYGVFERRISLPCEVDAARVHASLSDGVLMITLPKSAKAKQHERKIPVHS